MYRITIQKGMAGRVQPIDEITEDESPKFGFYWWFFTPKINHNGGSFKNQEVVDVSIMWLCFWFGLVFWPNFPRKEGDV